MGERINISTEVNCHLKKNEIDKIKYKLYIQNKDVKTIMFTSTKKGEGKSTIMLALANSIASDQKNVLVVCYGDASFLKKDFLENQIIKSDVKGLDFLRVEEYIDLTNIPTDAYDYILIETENLEKTKKSIEIAENSDLIILVVEANRTNKNAVGQSISELKISECNNIQVILNRFKCNYRVIRKRG